MVQTYRADVIAADAAKETAPIEFKSFLVTCTLCSVAGLTVLAILAQALVSFLAPVA